MMGRDTCLDPGSVKISTTGRVWFDSNVQLQVLLDETTHSRESTTTAHVQRTMHKADTVWLIQTSWNSVPNCQRIYQVGFGWTEIFFSEYF